MSDGSGTAANGLGRVRAWARRGWYAAWRALALTGLSVLGTVLLCFLVVGVTLVPLGVGAYMVPAAVTSTRWLANTSRRLSAEWSGVPIPVPYQPRPREFGAGIEGWWRRWRWMFADPATWRDLLWLSVNPGVLGVIGAIPVSILLSGGWYVALPFLWPYIQRWGWDVLPFELLIDSQAGAFLLAPPLATAILALGLYCGPPILRAHGRFTRSLLGPTREQLAARVQHLAETRTDAVDTQAAELRRIERDLHDGAQARLVAMGMSIGAAERLLDDNPEAARALLIEAREASAKALDELRDLVRGIHPPVLADRGLGDAVRALALDHPLAVELSVDLPGRMEPPVESAAYFAVSEVLANAAKHSGARRVWVDLRYGDGRLRMNVTDDGRGGATMAPGGPAADARGTGGTGLHGIERRLATFDGVLALNSPAGGPTMVMMELPCALSSPKTSSS